MERSLPADINAERAVLGSVMLERDAIIAIAPWLPADYFYLEKHAWIYGAMLACYNRRVPPDLSTIADELRRNDRLDLVGGIMYLGELVAEVPTAVHVEYYARIVERTAILRRLIETGGKIARLGYQEEEDLETTLDKAEAELFAVSQRRIGQDFVHIGKVVDEYFEQINYLNEHRGEVGGLPTGYRDLDEITGGLQASDLIILAARPSVGKTSLALSIAYHVGLKHNTVGIFSLEMSREQLVQRMIAMHTGIDTQRLRTGNIRDHDLQAVMDAMGILSAAPIYIEDTPGLSITDVRSKARRLHAEAGISLLIIDYLQLMQGRRTDNRVQEVSEISRGLKALARELHVPVIALSQLSRAVEGRINHVPVLSDLRESGCLTGDARVYLPDEGIYRRMDELVGTRGFNVLALNMESWYVEPAPVLKAFATGHKPVYWIKTRTGRAIRATANHQFLTIHGWKRLDELESSERIALLRQLPGSSSTTLVRPEQTYAGYWIGNRCILSCQPIYNTTQDGTRAEAIDHLALTVSGTTVLSRMAYKQLWYPVSLRTRGHANQPPPLYPTLAAGRTGRAEVYWDTIVAIEFDGVADVYDLTVDIHHNFVANDFIVHNSIEQDADIVMFIYREDLYDKETDKKGIAEIHIAKHRNGPLGVVPLRFEANTTLFQNLERYRVPEGY